MKPTEAIVNASMLCFLFFSPENQKSLSGSPAAPVPLLTFSVASKTQYLPLSSRSGFLLRGPIYLACEERNLKTRNTLPSYKLTHFFVCIFSTKSRITLPFVSLVLQHYSTLYAMIPPHHPQSFHAAAVFLNRVLVLSEGSHDPSKLLQDLAVVR